MSFITDLTNKMVNRIAEAVADRVITSEGRAIAQARAYRLSLQPRQLKVKPGQHDDNLILNFTGLIANRNVSQLIGKGVSFKFEQSDAGDETNEENAPGANQEEQQSAAEPAQKTGETRQEAYIRALWDANKQEILLHRAALAACEAGTGYFLICDPKLGMGAAIGKDGVAYERLLLLDPAFMRIETLPEDFEAVLRYIQEYKFVGVDGKQVMRRKTIELDPETEKWIIVDAENSAATANKWQVVNALEWPYPFSPVIHWQNLPTVDSPYGEPDLDGGLLATQDNLNMGVSSLNKSMRLGADPFRYTKGLESWSKIEIGPDKIPNLPKDSEYHQEPPSVDWEGSLSFAKFIRAAMFDIARTVDVDSITDKIGTLTNFALRVLYQDNVSKIDTKRELFGDMLCEINRRVQVMHFGDTGALETSVVWPEFLPTNVKEIVDSIKLALESGIISKQTAFELTQKTIGLDGTWEDEHERMDEESAGEQNVGAMVIRNFLSGNGATPPSTGLVGSTNRPNTIPMMAQAQPGQQLAGNAAEGGVSGVE